MANKLTNKFTKSVLEREQKEQRTVESISPAQAAAPAEASPVTRTTPQPDASPQPISQPSGALKSVPVRQPAPSTTPAKTAKKNAPSPSMNLDAFLNRNENRQAKNKTFYLDTAVIDAIKQAATENNVAESKLVNDVLKKILGV